MRPSENVQFSECFRATFKSFWIVFGSFWIVFASFFASFRRRRRRRRDVVFGIVVDRSIKKLQKRFLNFSIFLKIKFWKIKFLKNLIWKFQFWEKEHETKIRTKIVPLWRQTKSVHKETDVLNMKFQRFLRTILKILNMILKMKTDFSKCFFGNAIFMKMKKCEFRCKNRRIQPRTTSVC